MEKMFQTPLQRRDGKEKTHNLQREILDLVEMIQNYGLLKEDSSEEEKTDFILAYTEYRSKCS
ncbi:MAG: hypothetical protein GF311_16840 [Candidatus Lokiarchaeota archaeon]|nr:hypothetical protein [Candidatus Lokiarchaeota archaeon]